MTTENFTPAPTYTVGGTGPYAITHSYKEGSDIVVEIWVGTVKTVLIKDTDFTVVPDVGGSTTTGDVTLSATAATTYAGASLAVRRATDTAQGWMGVVGPREAGLEVQLDRTVMALQDNSEKLRRAALLPTTSGIEDLLLPEPVARKALQARADGLGWENGPDSDEIANAQADATAAAASAAAAAASEAASVINVTTTPHFFSGDGVTTNFALPYAPVGVNGISVYIDGVHQDTNSISVSGTTLVFAVAPPTGTDNIVARMVATGVTNFTEYTNVVVKKEYKTLILMLADTEDATYFSVNDHVRVVEDSTTYQVVSSGGDEQNSAAVPVQFDRLGENVLYRKGKYDYHLITGAVYNNAGTWELVQDGSHEPINVDSVTVVGDELKINYASIGTTKVVSFIVAPDERFSQAGIIAGASVGADEASIRIGAPLNFSIDMDNGVVTTQDWWAGSVTAAFAGDYMEITHPSVYVDINLNIDQIQSVDALYVRNSQTREATTRTRIWPRTDIYGYLSYDGAAWSETNINTQFQGAISTNFTGGELVVSHPSNGSDKALNITGRHPYHAMSDSFGSTSFNVRFVNANTGPDVTVEDTNMRFQFERKNVKCIEAGVREISMGEWAFKAPMAWIPDPTLLDISLGNFFFVGVMEVDTTL